MHNRCRFLSQQNSRKQPWSRREQIKQEWRGVIHFGAYKVTLYDALVLMFITADKKLGELIDKQYRYYTIFLVTKNISNGSYRLYWDLYFTLHTQFCKIDYFSVKFQNAKLKANIRWSFTRDGFRSNWNSPK